MKAAKIIVVLIAVAAAIWVLTQRGGGADHILITEVTATTLMNGDLAVTMTIENRGDPDQLTSVSSPEATTGLHSPDAPTGPPVPGGAAVSLATDGAHIRLSALRGEAAEGRLIPLTLEFANAGAVVIKAQIRRPAMKGGMAMMHHNAMLNIGPDEPGPTVAISANPDGNTWRITVNTNNFTFSKDNADGPHVPGQGHGHLYIGGTKVGRVYGETAEIGALPPGEHLVRLTLNANDHRVLMVGGAPVTATTTIQVD